MGRTPWVVVGLIVVQLALAAAAHAQAPSSSASPPASSNSATFYIPYTASPDAQQVELWVKRPGDSAYTQTNAPHDAQKFTYTADAGSGAYSFYTVASDGTTTEAPPPSGSDGSTVVETNPGFVASVALLRGQDLNTVLHKGLVLELTAYRQVTLKLELSLSPASARALRMSNPRVAAHNWQVIMPKVYPLRLRLNRAAIKRMRKVKRVHFELRSVLATNGGNSIATNPLTFGRP